MTESPNPAVIDADTLTGDMHPIRRAVLSIGSNLGERMYALQGAVDALGDTPEVWVTGVSPVYETEPVDAPVEPFLQLVLALRHPAAAPLQISASSVHGTVVPLLCRRKTRRSAPAIRQSGDAEPEWAIRPIG